MEKIFNLTSTFKALDEDDSGVMISGYASTKDFDRAGDTIMPEAWTKGGLNNFEKNPIILFNHNYDKPIGRATGLKVTENGLEMKAKISKSAPENVATLVKEGILGAFSVGFRIKDADYLEETDGLKIKDAELFEVSVVSVPCNQAATFSLAKSFDSIEEYNEFKKTFTNRVDLAGQSLAKDEDSLVASDTPDGAEDMAQKEINMSEVNTPEIDLEAFAKRVADETAAKIAMKQAEEKAAAAEEAKAAQEAAEAEAAKQAEVETVIKTGIESGTERLVADFQEKLNERDANFEEVVSQFKKDLEEKNEEITKMRESKRVFADRDGKKDLTPWGQDFVNAHMLGVITGKGWETDYARDIQEKAGIQYTARAGDIDQEVSSLIEKEIMNELKVARLFREIPVNGKSTILPIQPDSGRATWEGVPTPYNSAFGNLQDRNTASSQFQAFQVTMEARRLISTTYMDNDLDEAVLINLMPMLTEGVARAHGRAVERAFLMGNGGGGIAGLDGEASAYSASSLDISDGEKLNTASSLLGMRQEMGKYGLNPSDVTYIVGLDSYYTLLNDAAFQTLDEVGSDLAVRVTGALGAVYGSPIVVSEEITETDGDLAAVAVNTRSFVVPRLRGVTVEQDYEIANQRRVLVATQNLGFTKVVPSVGTHKAAIKWNWKA
jgi:HK97 family phage prohead protease